MAGQNKRISLIVQAGKLKSMFPGSQVVRNGEESLIWIHTITPTPLSDKYKIKIVYRRYKGVKCFVLEPRLQLADGEKVLPHVYSTPEQQLCLFFPDGSEWNTGMLYTETIVPWASEWLYHYEIWLATGGIWHGGGTLHGSEGDIEESLRVEVARRNERLNEWKHKRK